MFTHFLLKLHDRGVSLHRHQESLGKMWFFTADEHYGHASIIESSGRPFETCEEMDAALIQRHNSVVRQGDVVIHAGDFTMQRKAVARHYIRKLNGEHVFLRGNHDRWMKAGQEIWEGETEGQYVVVCHYAMRVWARSDQNSWQLYGHSHGNLDPIGKQWDIGVDNNGFTPVAFAELQKIMASRPDNPHLMQDGR